MLVAIGPLLYDIRSHLGNHALYNLHVKLLVIVIENKCRVAYKACDVMLYVVKLEVHVY